MVLALYLTAATAVLWLIHRFVCPLSRAAALVLLVLPMGITGLALVTGGVYGPIDHPYATEPLSSLKLDYGIGSPHNATATDVYSSMFPWRRSVQASLERGEWPLWNPYMLSGHLLAANSQSAAYNPFTILACLVPAAVSFTFTAAIAMLIAAAGAFVLAREIDCGELAALAGATGWAYAASVVLYLHTAMGFTLVYQAFLFAAAARVARKPVVASAMFLTIVLALMILAGHPETLYLCVITASTFAVFELVRARVKPWRSIGAAAAAGVLALLLSAIHLVPFASALPQSTEYQFKEFSSDRPLRPMDAERLLATIATDLFPHLHVRQWVKPELGLIHAETAAAGSVVLALALYAAWRTRSPHTWFFVAIALFGIVIECRWPPAVKAIKKLPLMDIAHDERLAFTAALALAILAAMGLDQILRESDLRGAALTFTAVLAFLGAGALWLSRNTDQAITFGDFGEYTLFAELFFLGLAALLLTWPAASLRFAGPALLALLVAQRVISTHGTYKTYPARAAYPPVPILEPLEKVPVPFRIVGLHYAFLPGSSAYYGLEDVRGYEAMTFMPLVQTWAMWCRHQSIWFNRVDDLTPPFLSFMNVRYAIVSNTTQVPAGWRELVRQRDAALLENTRALDRAFVPKTVKVGLPPTWQIEDMRVERDFGETAWITANVAPHTRENGPGVVRIREYSPGGRYLLDADMQRDGWVVISATAWDGWRAYIDGRRVETQRANIAFLSVLVPAGRHSVRIVYWPDSFVRGRAITFATLAALVVFATMRRTRPGQW